MSDQGPQLHQDGIARRGFIGAGLATTAAALLAPAGAGAHIRSARASADGDTALAEPGSHQPTVPPDLETLVPIGSGRVSAAVGQLDAIITDTMRRTGVPGVAAAVVHRGRLLYADGFGVRDVRTGAPVNTQTVFRLASVSKSLSATVVAGIVGRKQTGWDEPVIGHLPGFALKDPYVTEHVTIADLFSHRSGLPDHAGDLLEDLGYDRQYILRALRLEPLDPFRAQWIYTNFGLTAAAESAANATGTNWAAIADTLLFAPLAMHDTSFRNADFLRRRDRAAMHVRIDGRWEQKYTRDADPEAPAGGASSNVLDLARWMELLLANGVWNGRAVIDADALGEAHLPRILSSHPSTPASRSGFYGCGTNVGYDYSGRLRLNHSGAFSAGASTVYSLLPSEDLGIVVLTNGMPIGLPESISAYFLDLVVAGSFQEDWLELFGDVFAGLYVNHSVLAGTSKPTHPRPARPDDFYLGTYDNDYYGSIRVVSRSSELHVLIGPHPDDYPLTHWDGDLFALYPTGENAVGISAATFTPDLSGAHAASVTLEYYNKTGRGVFTARSARGGRESRSSERTAPPHPPSVTI